MLFLFLSMYPILAQGQEREDLLLLQPEKAEDPVYSPVISFSYGLLNFLGDIQNSFHSASVGNTAGNVSISTYVGRQKNYLANFSFLRGNLGGNSYDNVVPTRNLNFRSTITSVTANFEYCFGHFIEKKALIRPYVSVGMGVLSFNAKGDLVNENGLTYYYWTDGSIMDAPQINAVDASPLYRDFNYETDLRKREQKEFGLGDYTQSALAFPISAGAHFRISKRTFFSLGVSYTYALSDVLDNVAYEGTSVQGKKGNDSFIYSHLSLHLDLFSNPKTRTDELLFTQTEIDPMLLEDEDGDHVPDMSDHCPGTRSGVEVDTLGCPMDFDMDGVDDYLDRELDTEAGAWVDENGVTLTEEEFLKRLELRNHAMPREDYNSFFSGEYRQLPAAPIPEKFRSLDADGDGTISFEELLQVIDQYFDSQLDLNLEDIRQLNDFFFSQ
jgi:hypothetical protein